MKGILREYEDEVGMRGERGKDIKQFKRTLAILNT